MAQLIEDYALIGDCHTAGLVGRDGSIDWLCFPRFDSPSTFGALLGTKDHGRWLLAPAGEVLSSARRYEEDSFVLVTRWVTADGEVEVTDFMPHGDRRADVIRRVTGIRGSVAMMMDLRFRFNYAQALPWVRQSPDEHGYGLVAVAGPDAVIMRGPELRASDHSHVAEFTVAAGETVDASMTCTPRTGNLPPALWWTTALPRRSDGGGTGHPIASPRRSTTTRCIARCSYCGLLPTRTPAAS